MILGVNGFIWISAHPDMEGVEPGLPSAHQQECISRTASAIRVLVKLSFPITPIRILEIYEVCQTPHQLSRARTI